MDRESSTPDGPAGTTEPGQDLRRRRAEVSRQAIRDAVAELLLTEHPANLSIPAVAKAAGVSVRTVYRYFPTKQDLLEDVAEVQQRKVDALSNGRENMFENPGAYLTAMWSDFEQNVEAIRAQHLSPLGAELRNNRLVKTREGTINRLEKSFPDAPDQDRQDLADVMITMMSSAAFLELHTRFGRSGPDAARLAWWAATAMQKQFAADGGIKT